MTNKSDCGCLLLVGLAFVCIYLNGKNPAKSGYVYNNYTTQEEENKSTGDSILDDLLEKAKSSIQAQYDTGLYYQKQENYKQALLWMETAASNGHKDAQCFMGTVTAEVRPKDSAEWHLKAAKQGHPFSQFSIGLMYANGNGVKRDLILSYAWLTISLQTNSKNFLATQALQRVKREMTASQIQAAQRKISEISSQIY